MSEVDVNKPYYSIKDVAEYSFRQEEWARGKERERFKRRLQDEIERYKTHGFTNNEDKIVIPVLEGLIKWLAEFEG